MTWDHVPPRGGRLGRVRPLVAAALFLLAIGLLREATGTTASGVGWLALLPVIWLALHHSRFEVVLGTAGVAAVFAVPVALAGGPDYPMSELWRGGFATLAAGTAGLTVQNLVRRTRRDAAELAASQSVARAILESAHDAFVSADSRGRITTFNPQAQALFGHAEDETIGRPLTLIIPERYHEAHQRGLARLTAGGHARVLGRRLELPALHRDGHEIPVELTLSAVRTGTGEHSFHAFLHDISDRKRAEDALREDARAMTAIAEATRALSQSTDPAVARAAICDAACEATNAPMAFLFEPDGPLRLTLSAAAGIELPPITVVLGSEQSGVAVAFLSREPFFVADVPSSPVVSQRLVAVTRAQSVLFQPVFGGGESPLGVLVIAWTDRIAAPSEHVTAAVGLLAAHAAAAFERSEMLARLDSLTRTDALTGLPNRRAWDQDLPREIERARRDGRPLTVAMLDMDAFSIYNAEHGHPGGDRLLKAAAAAWREELRAVDTVARCGGEEFGLILPGCEPEAALTVVERVRAGTPGGQTCSAGVAHWDGSETADAVLARADRALYAAKQGGRDRSVLA